MKETLASAAIVLKKSHTSPGFLRQYSIQDDDEEEDAVVVPTFRIEEAEEEKTDQPNDDGELHKSHNKGEFLSESTSLLLC